ncbi:MAG TPA: hypothetical protein VI756_21180 [Blastocatellia bacterium]
MWVDEIVEETRRAREEYAAKFNFDLQAIWEDLKRQEGQGRPPGDIPPGNESYASQGRGGPR